MGSFTQFYTRIVFIKWEKNVLLQHYISILVPPQAHEGGSSQSEGHMETVVSHIVHVFVDALPHVPEHRRLPILSQLMNTLGPSRFLWILMLLLFKQHATQTSISATGAEKVKKVSCMFFTLLTEKCKNSSN